MNAIPLLVTATVTGVAMVGLLLPLARRRIRRCVRLCIISIIPVAGVAWWGLANDMPWIPAAVLAVSVAGGAALGHLLGEWVITRFEVFR